MVWAGLPHHERGGTGNPIRMQWTLIQWNNFTIQRGWK
jgi:hypothetical protein